MVLVTERKHLSLVECLIIVTRVTIIIVRVRVCVCVSVCVTKVGVFNRMLA